MSLFALGRKPPLLIAKQEKERRKKERRDSRTPNSLPLTRLEGTSGVSFLSSRRRKKERFLLIGLEGKEEDTYYFPFKRGGGKKLPTPEKEGRRAGPPLAGKEKIDVASDRRAKKESRDRIILPKRKKGGRGERNQIHLTRKTWFIFIVSRGGDRSSPPAGRNGSSFTTRKERKEAGANKNVISSLLCRKKEGASLSLSSHTGRVSFFPLLKGGGKGAACRGKHLYYLF